MGTNPEQYILGIIFNKTYSPMRYDIFFNNVGGKNFFLIKSKELVSNPSSTKSCDFGQGAKVA